MPPRALRARCSGFRSFPPARYRYRIPAVGAATSRPRSEMLRIRIGLRRIRKILPLRAAGRRPYIHTVTWYFKQQFIDFFHSITFRAFSARKNIFLAICS